MTPCSPIITSAILIGGGALLGILLQLSIRAWVNYTRRLRHAKCSQS